MAGTEPTWASCSLCANGGFCGGILSGMSSPAFQRVAQFLQNEMRMSHIYQPLMLKLLLEQGGRAATRDIAGVPVETKCSQAESQRRD